MEILMKNCFLFDLDGTLANGDHRLHHIHKMPKDWTSYFAACGDDAPIPHMITILLSISRETDIFITSGRSDEVRSETMAWLRTHIPDLDWMDGDVYMRAAGDYRPDDMIKIEMLENIRQLGYNVLAAFDDRYRVVNAWRDAGIPCLQVAPGYF